MSAPTPPPAPSPGGGGGSAWKPFALLVTAAVLGGGVALGGAAAVGAFDSATSTTTVVEDASRRRAGGGARSAGGGADRERDLPPQRARSRPDHLDARLVRRQSQQSSQALGSGFVIDKEGHIVTNYHVVQGATSIEVRFSNDDTLKATLVGSDASTDIALLRVSAAPGALTPLTLADSDRVAGRGRGRRDRQPVRARADGDGGHRQRAPARGAGAQRLSRSITSSRPTRRSTTATAAARCSTRGAR